MNESLLIRLLQEYSKVKERVAFLESQFNRLLALEAQEGGAIISEEAVKELSTLKKIKRSPIPEAVTIHPAIHDDSVTCLVCGRSLKMIKSHLRAAHHLTVEEYRAQFGLPVSFPMVAPSYAKQLVKSAKKRRSKELLSTKP